MSSSIDDVKSVSDEQLGGEIDQLTPETVTEYVLYLRSELRAKEVELENRTATTAATISNMSDQIETLSSGYKEKLVTLASENAGLKEELGKLASAMEGLQLNSTPGPALELSSPTIGFQYWRGMTKDEIKALKPNVTEYEFAVIMLDWAESTEPKPNEQDVLELYTEIKQKDLEEAFIELLQDTLNNILDCESLEYGPEQHVYNYKFQLLVDGGSWCERLSCIENNKKYTISSNCSVEDCRFEDDEDNEHVVTIQFKTVLDRLEIKILPTKEVRKYREHTHDDNYQYEHWFLYSEGGGLCPLFSKTYTEIVQFAKDNHAVNLICLLQHYEADSDEDSEFQVDDSHFAM